MPPIGSIERRDLVVVAVVCSSAAVAAVVLAVLHLVLQVADRQAGWWGALPAAVGAVLALGGLLGAVAAGVALGGGPSHDDPAGAGTRDRFGGAVVLARVARQQGLLGTVVIVVYLLLGAVGVGPTHAFVVALLLLVVAGVQVSAVGRLRRVLGGQSRV